jgi:hypothetical protein
MSEEQEKADWEDAPRSWGGKRKGAGRKPRSTPLAAITVRIEPEHAKRFRSICKAKGLSQAKQITEWITKGK